MRADDPRHGTRAGRIAGCNCPRCVAANNAYCKQYRNRRYRIGGQRLLKDGAQARAHLLEMRHHYSTVALAHLIGTKSSSWVCGIITGKYRSITPDVERRVLAIRPGMDVGTSWVAAWPAQRRIKALMALGYSMQQLCTRIDYQRQNMASLVAGRKPYITSRVDQQIRSLYAELSMTLPKPADRFERAGVTKAKQTASRNGWLPPLGWDDIDDPHENTAEVTTLGDDDEWIDDVVVERILSGDMTLARAATTAERTEVCRRWVTAGGSLATLAKRSGWRPDRYYKTGDAA